MAIDSEEKRRATIGVLPVPDGTTSEADRRRSILIYGFGESGPAAVMATYQTNIETLWALPIIQLLFATDSALVVGGSYAHAQESLLQLSIQNLIVADLLLSLTANQTVSTDTTLALSATAHQPSVESISNVPASNNIAVDSLLSLVISQNFSVDSLLSLITSNGISADTALAVLATAYRLSLETTSDILLPNTVTVDTLLSLSMDKNISADTALALTAIAHQLSVESITNIPISNIITADTLLNTGLGAISTIEGLAAFIRSVGVSQESLSALYSTILSNIESASTLSVGHSLVGSSTSNIIDTNSFTISSLLALYANHTTAIDTLLAVLLANGLSGESGTATGLMFNSVIETLEHIALSNTMAIDALSETPVILLSKSEIFCIESISAIYANQNSMIESILSLLSTSTVSLGSLLATFGYYTPSMDSVSRFGLQFHVPTTTLARLSNLYSLSVTGLSEIDMAILATVEASAQVAQNVVVSTSSLRGLALTSLVNISGLAQILTYSANSVESIGSVQAIEQIPSDTSLRVSATQQSATESIILVLFEPSQLFSIDTLIGVLLNAGIAIDSDSLASTFEYPSELVTTLSEGRVYTLKVDNITVVAMPSAEQYGSIPEGVRVVSIGSNDIFKSTGN